MSMRQRRIVTAPVSSTDQPPRPRSTSSTHITSPLDPISPWPPILSDEPASVEHSSSTDYHAPSISTGSDLPTAKEIYGSIAVLLTGLGYVLYLVWAFLPPRYLEAIGWSWHPARDWALIIPCYLMLVVLLAYTVYAGLTVYLTPPWDAFELITDRHAHIPAREEGKDRYYWALSGEDVMPPAIDLPIDVVNRTLYPPRPRPTTRPSPS